MAYNFNFDGLGDNVRPLDHPDDWSRTVDVPQHLEQLPDGRESLVLGDPERCAEFNHQQGNNDLRYQQTCGLVSCEDILRQAGVQVTENDVVHHAAERRECHVDGAPEWCGGTSEATQAQILTDYGVPSHPETGHSLEDLANALEHGHGVIAEVNCGVLWNNPNPVALGWGQANHAIVVTGVARDPQTSEIQGFFINDSGTGQSDRFVDAETMKTAWLVPWGTGSGTSVVTDSILS